MPTKPAYVPDMTAPAAVTAEQLLQMSFPDKRVELVRGVVVVREPPGYVHGKITVNLMVELGNHVRQTGAGQLLGETGFTLTRGPDTVRGPDLAFIRRERLPDPETIGFLEQAPDLAVEVWSPRNRPGEMLAKVADYLAAGTRLVWVIHPQRREARVYRADGTETLVSEAESLDGEDVVPGFTCRLEAIL